MAHSDDDDEKTVIRPTTSVRPAMAAESNTPSHSSAIDPLEHHALPIGTRLGEFEVTSVVGVGGFGIVYLAHDHSLGRKVALKEYMPSSLAVRANGITVSAKSERHADTFGAGLSSFMNEARLLAMFDHPSLVKVYRFWEANGTAYMVMPFYEGLTLKQALRDMPSPPSEGWLRDLLNPLMDAMSLLHGESCFHRDIAPDNILLLKDGRPVLLDFGAARQVIGDLDKNLTVILKPGYAPIEQYADIPNVRQGAWTDIYALAAVVHYAITGKPPLASVARVISDAMTPLSKAAEGRYSDNFLRAMDKALTVRPEQRPQTVQDLRHLLAQGGAIKQPQVAAKSAPAVKSSQPAPASSNKGLWAGGLLGVATLAGVGLFFAMSKGSEPVKPANAVAASTPLPTPVAAAVPAGPALMEPAKAIAGAAPSGSGDPVVSAGATLSVARAFSAPMDALTQLFEQRERDQAVTVNLDRSQLKIGKDKIRFRVKSAKSGYLYVMMIGTDKGHLNLLFPNGLDSNNKVVGGKEVSLPGAGWAMTAEGPRGINEFVAIVSEHPRDFTRSGLTKTGHFGEFSFETLAKLSQADAAANPLGGTAVCPTAKNCSGAYGAARFSIEEID